MIADSKVSLITILNTGVACVSNDSLCVANFHKAKLVSSTGEETVPSISA